MSTSTSFYVIDLTLWGITQGIPSKPYAAANYTTANNNINGINNAISWAYTNGYDYVVLPKGNYAICYPNTINTQPNMTIDFNFSTLKVIYDSNDRSPLDTSTNPIYQFGGDSIHVTTPRTHIKNLILIGDRVDRSWANVNEKSMESTNGVKFGAGAHFSSIRNCNLSYYMGDAVALYYSPYSNFDIGTTQFGSLDNNSGSPIAGVTSLSVRSVNFISIPNSITSFSMIGLGYNPTTSIPNGEYNIYFYNSSNTFIYKKLNARTRDIIQIPKNATKLKLSWEGNGTIDDGCLPNNPPYWATLIQNGVADHICVEYNEIHRCHRGGLFLGTNNALIRKNYFHDTGAPDGYDIDGLPQFPDFTRYAINTEDNVGQNCKIVENIFDNCRIAIALRGEYNEVSSNEIRNCPIGVELYYQRHITINKNYFYQTSVQCFNYYNFDRDWIITENVFNSSGMYFQGSGTISSVCNNRFMDSSEVSNEVSVLNFKANTFDNSKFQFIETLTVVDGCAFINSSSVNVISISSVIDNIIRCKFLNNSQIYFQNSPQVIVRDSYFDDSGFYYNTGTLWFTLINCNVNNITRPLVKSDQAADIGLVDNTLEITNSIVSLGLAPPAWQSNHYYNIGDVIVPSTLNGYYYQCYTAGTSGATEPTWGTTTGNTTGTRKTTDGNAQWNVFPLVQVPLMYAFNWGKLIITNSTVNFNTLTNYTHVILDYYGQITDSIQIRNSILTGTSAAVSNPINQTNDIYIDSESLLTKVTLTSPSVPIQSDQLSTVPVAGTFAIGQKVANAKPVGGGFEGWICITAGIANNNAWASSHYYNTGNLIYSGNYVYKAITTGTSGGSVPKFPTTLNATVVDNQVTWQNTGKKAIFKQFGVIST